MSGYSAPRLIAPQDALDKFSCGEPEMDDWLRRFALANNAGDTSKTYVTLKDDQVVGYYALATGGVQRASAPARIGKGQPALIPVVLLARLAVNASEQGHGLGSHLLRDAIVRSVGVANTLGVRALLVHALHNTAREFYLHHDFEPSPTDPLHLFLLMKDARALLASS